MATEFGTPFTISERRRLYTDEERSAFLEALHPAFTTLWFADHPQSRPAGDDGRDAAAPP